MKTEHIKKQIVCLDELIDIIKTHADRMFDECENETKGMGTLEANEYYRNEYRTTQNTLYGMLKLASNRAYKLSTKVNDNSNGKSHENEEKQL